MLTMGFRRLFSESQRHSEQNGDAPISETPIFSDLNPGIDVGTSEPVAEVTNTEFDESAHNSGAHAAAEEEEHDLSKTVQHIMKYPVAKSTIESVQSVKPPRLIAPYLVELRKSAPIKPVFEYVDNLNDDLLTQIDKHIPQLQTVEPHDIMETVSAPVVAIRHKTSRVTHDTEDVINSRIVLPMRKFVADFRKRYSTVLEDSNGRAMIRSQLDAIVKPVNDRLEKFIEEHLAEGDSVPEEGFSNELSRSSRILLNGVQRARPVIKSAPNRLTGHIASTYSEFKTKDGDTFFDSIRATMQTAGQLSSETFSSMWRMLGFGADSNGQMET